MYKSKIKKTNTFVNQYKQKHQNHQYSSQNKLNSFLHNDEYSKKQTKFKTKDTYNFKKSLNFTKQPSYNISHISKIHKNNDEHSKNKETSIQALKDMIFSPGDINFNEHAFLNKSSRAKSIDKMLYSYKNEENGGTNINISSSKKIKNTITSNLLPAKINNNKKTLVLDLDETLIHSAFEPFKPKDDIILKMRIKNIEYTIHVLKRPFVDKFLDAVSKLFEVVIFTASIPEYANPLLNKLDPFNKIFYRLYREHCTKTAEGLFIKDLNKLGRNLKDVIIIDNNPISYKLNKTNGLPILTWHSIQNDNELMKLLPLLEYLANVDDVRPVINQVVNGYYINYNIVNKLIDNNNRKNNVVTHLSNNNEDDYFKNWFSSKTKPIENNTQSKNKDTFVFEYKDNKKERKKSFDHIFIYKGLLGSNDTNINYKTGQHNKIFNNFLEKNDSNIKTTKSIKDFNNNKINLNNQQNKKGKSSGELIIISPNNNINHNKNIFSINDYNHETKTPTSNYNKIEKDINDTNTNLNTSKLNISITTNYNKSSKSLIDLYTVNDKSIMTNKFSYYNNLNNSIFSNNSSTKTNTSFINKSQKQILKYGYKSANNFYTKEKDTDVLSDLIDNLINNNKKNKTKNIEPNQLIAFSNINKNNTNNSNLCLKSPIDKGRELLNSIYNNTKRNGNLNHQEQNRYIINQFLNNNSYNKTNSSPFYDYKRNNSYDNKYLRMSNINAHKTIDSVLQRNRNELILNSNNGYNRNKSDIRNGISILKGINTYNTNKSVKRVFPLSNFQINF